MNFMVKSLKQLVRLLFILSRARVFFEYSCAHTNTHVCVYTHMSTYSCHLAIEKQRLNQKF